MKILTELLPLYTFILNVHLHIIFEQILKFLFEKADLRAGSNLN